MGLLARSFAERDYDVHMVTYNHGQPDGERRDNIRIWGAVNPDAGIPVLRFIHPRLTGFFAALHRARADVYVQSSAAALTGLSAWFCRRRGAAFVYRVSHDSNCVPGGQHIRYSRDRKLYEYGLRGADLIVAQTLSQQEALKRNYGLRSHIGGSLVEPPATCTDIEKRTVDVLWVGRIQPIKKPELALELARILSNSTFRVVGGPNWRTQELFDELKRRAAGLANVEMMGYQTYQTTRTMFSQAKVFLSTSQSEGFPNTYLQAWIAGTPVIAFFDPDGLIERERLGIVVRNREEAVEVASRLLKDSDLWRQYSERARSYALAHHGPKVVDRYESLIEPAFDGTFVNEPVQQRDPVG